jgi:hypothetical protein
MCAVVEKGLRGATQRTERVRRPKTSSREKIKRDRTDPVKQFLWLGGLMLLVYTIALKESMLRVYKRWKPKRLYRFSSELLYS